MIRFFTPAGVRAPPIPPPRRAECVCPPSAGVPCVLRFEMAVVHPDCLNSSSVISSPSTVTCMDILGRTGRAARWRHSSAAPSADKVQSYPDVNFESFFTKVWREHEDIIALVDALTNATYTFGELLDASQRVAAGLRMLGLCTGDVVAFHGQNSSELMVAMCGTFFAGGTGMFLKGSLNRGEMHNQLADAKSKFVFCELEKIRGNQAGLQGR
ncbi:hypothetical protein MTO96_028932 [Rhipicephalus appendiculatus]